MAPCVILLNIDIRVWDGLFVAEKIVSSSLQLLMINHRPQYIRCFVVGYRLDAEGS